jgi:class 3 adenylate cyclase
MSVAAAASASRRLGGVLVTDLVGSTRLRTSLGDERAEPLRRAHEQLLRAIVARHSGRVEQWLGDGILATFESVSSAARAAIDVQQATERRNRLARREAELEVRVGFAGGEIVWERGDCVGRPVDEASAACAAARGGEILAPRSVLALVGSRQALRQRAAAGDRVEVVWEPPRSAAGSLGVPASLHTSGQLPWTGRKAAMSLLRDAYQRAASGEPQLVAIRGDAGIGKTRLVAEFSREIDALGGAIVYAGAQQDSAGAYDPLDKALRHWVRSVEDLAARLGPSSGELARLVPELLERVPDLPPPSSSDPEHEQLLLRDAFLEWLRVAALDDPIVLLLDSLHWAGRASFDLLTHVLFGLGESRVLIVTTQRGSDPRVPELIDAGERALGASAARLVDLVGLSAGEVTDLVSGVREGTPAGICATLHLITRGNPLHVAELLRRSALGDTPHDLPQTVVDALRETALALDAFTYRVLETASVIGESFEAPLLADMLGDSEAAFDALERAARAGILRELDRERLVYGFSHALLQRAFYDEVSGARLALLHERAGLALERRGGASARSIELAHHFAHAAPLGHAERAARYAAAAGRQALAQFANERALEFFREAQRHYAGAAADRERCELAVDTGEALRRIGDASFRRELADAADRAHALGDGQLMGRALLATYRGTFSRAMHVDRAQVERLRSALGLLGDSDPALRARLLALLGTELAWAPRADEGDRASDEALALARELGSRELLAEVLAQRHWSVFHPIAERLATTRELDALASADLRPTLRFEAAGGSLFTAARVGDPDAKARALATLRGVAREADQPLIRWMLALREATAALGEARFADARAYVEEGIAIAKRADMPDVDAQRRVQMFWIDADTQSVEVARSLVASAAKAHREVSPINWPALALRCVELELPAERDAVLGSLAPTLATLRRGQAWLWTLCSAAAAAADARNLALCEQLFAQLAPHVDEHANIVFATIGSTARYTGLLARALGREEAPQHLARAVASNRAFGLPAWQARALLDLAEATADPATALAALAEAEALSVKFALPVVRERAERTRRRLGG